MTVLFVITGLGMGGAENQIVNLADKFADKGLDITIAYILQPVMVEPKNENVKLVSLGGTKSAYGILVALKNLVKLIRKNKPAVVHSHMYHANILARVARIFAPVSKLVSTAHNTNEGGKVRMLTYRLTNCLSDVFTNVSIDAVRAFEQKKAVSKGKILAVGNGIDVAHFRFSSAARNNIRVDLGLAEKKVFIAIGRFQAQKDYPNLIDAFAKVVSSNDNCHLLIVGDGELRSVIEEKIAQLDLQRSVTLLGVRKDIPDLLSTSDVFVLSSAWEGFGLVVAEAMSCERIVIGTDSGGVANIIDRYGYVVSPRDPDSLAQGMQKALALSEMEASELGQKARQRIVEHFSLDAAVQKWLDIYGMSNGA
ncbi:glycosyltransferase [Pseudomonas sp. GD03721]|uniref:Glycosyltransferase n=1 Tax=Ectopseudomonas oleovorans TaxID=301 RepID=A0AB35L0I4_ECTOL|nr:MULTISPECIES: glycosyltransferase [Pseudomonas]MCR1828856.1 glycosyltransferase [Pseudomonas oleovorans]MDH0568539.1 glycosyltransferase [Pseudomonas oleovorans]MDH1444237.1 glycosyltransferase [Pseudomonas sp. GD03722]WGG03242.1 glycosyltransferase [Pseudomonas sp. GD03721]WGG07410.1 glycosyltransferase [Pseudomonas sp. GD03919]